VAISVDAATAARFGGPLETGPTSASFTPAADSLFVLVVIVDTATGGDVGMAVTNSVGLTFTSRVERDGSEDTGGHVSIWTAPVGGSPAAMTITCTTSGGGTSVTAKPYIITGHNVGAPIGANSEGSSATNAITPAFATATGAGRWFYGGVDWNALGAPTSTDTENAGHFAGLISFMSVFKAADHANGSSNNGSLDASGAGAADWNWCALEILAAAGGATTSDSNESPGRRQRRRNPGYYNTMARTRSGLYVPPRLAA